MAASSVGGGSAGASGGRSGGARPTAGASGARTAREPSGATTTLCAFWLGQQCFALAAEIVGEVVAVETLTPVPLAPAAIRGIFNLRGTPVACVDLARALGLPASAPAPEPRPGQTLTALVLRTRELLLGVLIDRMEMVVPPGRGQLRPRTDNGEESVLVTGFLEIAERGALVTTVLGSDEVLARLSELRFQRAEDEAGEG